MIDLLQAPLLWLREHPGLLWVLVVTSAVIFLGALVAVPLFLTWIPADYFLPSRREQRGGWTGRHPGLRIASLVAKNLLGALLVMAGFAMLVLPGQGFLTMFVGMVLLDLPGKRKFEIALLRRPQIRRAIDWLRRRRGQAPLELPQKRRIEFRRPAS
jgi:hypothetical protein